MVVKRHVSALKWRAVFDLGPSDPIHTKMAEAFAGRVPGHQIPAAAGVDHALRLADRAPGTVVRLARGAVARRLDDDVPAPADEARRPSGTAADRAIEPPTGPLEN